MPAGRRSPGGGDNAVRQGAGRVLAHALLEDDEGGDADIAQRCRLHQEVAGELGEDAALLVLGHGVEGVVAVDEGLEVGLGDEGLDVGRRHAFQPCHLLGREAHGELLAHAAVAGRDPGEGAVEALAGGVVGGGEHGARGYKIIFLFSRTDWTGTP